VSGANIVVQSDACLQLLSLSLDPILAGAAGSSLAVEFQRHALRFEVRYDSVELANAAALTMAAPEGPDDDDASGGLASEAWTAMLRDVVGAPGLNVSSLTVDVRVDSGGDDDAAADDDGGNSGGSGDDNKVVLAFFLSWAAVVCVAVVGIVHYRRRGAGLADGRGASLAMTAARSDPAMFEMQNPAFAGVAAAYPPAGGVAAAATGGGRGKARVQHLRGSDEDGMHAL
jgi:hypothetical protein